MMCEERKVLKCPFCGGDTKRIVHEEEWYIECKDCGAVVRDRGFWHIPKIKFKRSNDRK